MDGAENADRKLVRADDAPASAPFGPASARAAELASIYDDAPVGLCFVDASLRTKRRLASTRLSGRTSPPRRWARTA